MTRNSHREGIRTFLAERHLGHIVVRSAKLEAKSKSEVLRELLAAGARAVFADDDPHELLDPGVCDLALRGKLVRVRFARGSLN